MGLAFRVPVSGSGISFRAVGNTGRLRFILMCSCDSSFRQHLNFAACIAAFACFLLTSHFPAFLRSSSPFGSLWIPPQSLFFPRGICITGFSPVASHSLRLIDPNIYLSVAYITASIHQQNIFIPTLKHGLVFATIDQLHTSWRTASLAAIADWLSWVPKVRLSIALSQALLQQLSNLRKLRQSKRQPNRISKAVYSKWENERPTPQVGFFPASNWWVRHPVTPLEPVHTAWILTFLSLQENWSKSRTRTSRCDKFEEFYLWFFNYFRKTYEVQESVVTMWYYT